jgi:hypothetical protein
MREPVAARRGVRRLAAALALVLLLSPALAGQASAAQCVESLCVRFAIGSCELSITNLTSPDGSTLGEPTLSLQVAGIECTYQPFSCPMGVGGMLKCFARMLRPFVQVEAG